VLLTDLEQVRQLAAILMRSKVARFWTRFPEALQKEMREGLLDAIMKEPKCVVFADCLALILGVGLNHC
jgi:hypothetical protein